MGHSTLFKEIDKAIPNSKFILTVRNTHSFTKSYQNYFKGSPWEIKNPQELKKLVQEYEERNRLVIEYFKNKQSQLLVINIIDGEGWEKICDFLNKPMPNRLFPQKNVGKYKKT